MTWFGLFAFFGVPVLVLFLAWAGMLANRAAIRTEATGVEPAARAKDALPAKTLRDVLR